MLVSLCFFCVILKKTQKIFVVSKKRKTIKKPLNPFNGLAASLFNSNLCDRDSTFEEDSFVPRKSLVVSDVLSCFCQFYSQRVDNLQAFV